MKKLELIEKIKLAEAEILKAQYSLKQHKAYFHELAHNNKLTLLSLFIPAFLAGWKQGKVNRSGRRVRGLLRFLLTTLLSQLNLKQLFKF